MPFTALPAKSNGSSTLSKAEVQDLFDNVAWLSRVSAVRVYSIDLGETIDGTLSVLDWTPGAGWHAEWSVSDGATTSTFTDLTGGLWINVGDVHEGIWIAGVMMAVESDGTGYGSFVSRRLQMRRGDGSTFTEMADIAGLIDPYAKRWSEHLCGLGSFNSSTDRVDVRGQQLPAPATAQDVLRDRRWALRFGSNDATWAVNYVPARPTSSGASGTQVVTWWNNMRSNQYRIERRPSAQRYKAADTAILANTSTQMPLGNSDWSVDPDMAPGVGSTSVIEIQQRGLYLVTAQNTFDLNTGTARGEVFATRDGGNTLAYANIPDPIPTVAHNTTVACQGIAVMNAGSEVELYARASQACDVLAGRQTNVTATLLSSDDGVSTGRQMFAELPAEADWPDFADYSGSYLPLGVMKLVSDLTDRLWHRPAFKASLSEDEIEIEANGGWTDIDCGVVEIDFTDYEDTFGTAVFSNGGLTLPHPGLWLCGAFLQYSPRTAEGQNNGNEGHRGMRLALGKNAAVGMIITKAMNVSTQGWARTLCEPVVINNPGVEVKLQGLVGGPDDDAARFGAVPVLDANLWAVEIGRGVTRSSKP